MRPVQSGCHGIETELKGSLFDSAVEGGEAKVFAVRHLRLLKTAFCKNWLIRA
ncbi:hypothetical protein BOA8489_02786 [Boseongicola aestuarii]|uniref:Uncharacterized protein n=1 Tax=Boseongicola aestuarii TaxID=1470561 RepID=A0A238J1P8_9RHOB|nr:hypothetical protein BOA8489_02786 [Boseongicola aestuarii]